MKKYYAALTICFMTLIIISCKKNPVEPKDKENTLPDSTSHEYYWQADTVGSFMSNLMDVWGTDANNVYADGLLNFIDSSSGTKNIIASSIMHWDGKTWSHLPYMEGILILRNYSYII